LLNLNNSKIKKISSFPLKKIFFLLFSFFFILNLPYSDYVDLGFIVFIIIIFFSIKTFKKFKLNFDFYFLVILICLNLFISNNNIIEKNGIFLPNIHNKYKYFEIDELLFQNLEKKFIERYDSENINCEQNTFCWKDTALKNIFSKNLNILNVFNINKFQKKINNINHSDLSSARIRMINNSLLNWNDWSTNSYIKRNNAPYFIIYKFNNNYNNSDLCWKGKAIVLNDKREYLNYKEKKCLKIKNNLEILFFNFSENLQVNLKKNINIQVLEYINLIIQFLSLTFLIKFFIKKIDFAKLKKIFLVTSLSTIYIIYVFYNRVIFENGYFPLQGGMDGLVHESYGSNMTFNLINLNFFEFFRGGESVYYFMPGLRYILSIMNLFFGDTFNAILLILIFFPVVIYFALINLKLGKKFILIFIIAFIFLKIPYIGFSFNHFLRGALTIYPETFAVFFFFIFLIFLLKDRVFLSGIFCSLIIFLRPNYLPICVITFIYYLYLYYDSQNFKKLFLGTLGLSFVFLIPFHNLFYGQENFAFLTSSSKISVNLKVHPSEYFYFFSNKNTQLKITNHLLNLISTGERNNFFAYFINSIFLTNVILFNIFMNKYLNKRIVLISFFAISLLTVSLFYSNTGRYAYFPWFLIFISNILIIKQFFNREFIFLFLKKIKFSFN
jgi:hypothetical protein